MRLSLVRSASPDWQACVDLIRSKYAAHFRADVSPTPDVFVAVRREPDEVDAAAAQVLACAGVYFGSPEPFFSERYLDVPVEVAARAALSGVVDRTRIVEIGGLATLNPGPGRELIRLTPLLIWCLGMQCILCTATSPLRKTFDKLDIPFRSLAKAEAGRLTADELARWGSYYDSDPQVGVIPVAELAPLFRSSTGRYSFSDPEVRLLRDGSVVTTQEQRVGH